MTEIKNDPRTVDSAEISGDTSRRRSLTLGEALHEFVRHPSPWMLTVAFVGAIIARIAVGDWQASDAWVPAIMIAVFPVYEWMIHVFILHWRPRRIGPITIDSLLASKHRAHHRDPRSLPLIFIPWQALIPVILSTVAIGVFAFPRHGLGLTYLVLATGIGVIYEWTHYLIHTDYRPVSKTYRAVWNNHRMHHYKNEHYWFTVTTSGTADRLLKTYPDPATVATSPTARSLHAGAAIK
jgi:hypothetical protein